MESELVTLLTTIEPRRWVWLVGLALVYLALQALLRSIIILYVLLFFQPQVASLLARASSIHLLGFRIVTWPSEHGTAYTTETKKTPTPRAKRRSGPS